MKNSEKKLDSTRFAFVIGQDEEHKFLSILEMCVNMAGYILDECGDNEWQYEIALQREMSEIRSNLAKGVDILHPLDYRLHEEALNLAEEIVRENIFNNRPSEEEKGKIPFNKLDDKVQKLYDSGIERILCLSETEKIKFWEQRCEMGGADPTAVLVEEQRQGKRNDSGIPPELLQMFGLN